MWLFHGIFCFNNLLLVSRSTSWNLPSLLRRILKNHQSHRTPNSARNMFSSESTGLLGTAPGFHVQYGAFVTIPMHLPLQKGSASEEELLDVRLLQTSGPPGHQVLHRFLLGKEYQTVADDYNQGPTYFCTTCHLTCFFFIGHAIHSQKLHVAGGLVLGPCYIKTTSSGGFYRRCFHRLL